MNGMGMGAGTSASEGSGGAQTLPTNSSPTAMGAPGASGATSGRGGGSTLAGGAPGMGGSGAMAADTSGGGLTSGGTSSGDSDPGGSTTGGSTVGGSNTGGSAAGGVSGGSAGAEVTGGGTGATPGDCDTSPGMAIQFAEGVTDQLTGNIGSDGPSGDAPRTLELWAKFTSANSWTAEQTIIELGRRNGAGDMIWGIDMSGREGTGGRFGPYTNGVTDNNGSSGPFFDAPADVGWLHLSWAYEGNGGEMVFAVNGEQLPIQDPGANYMLNLTPGIVTLGASQNFGSTGWDGVMDEVRIWTVYRSPQEIADTMNVFLTGEEEGLAAYYNFDTSDGTFADDVKGVPSHRLELCTAGNDDRCTATNNAMPMVVASDIPGPFTCAE
jgi:hypothetical protein